MSSAVNGVPERAWPEPGPSAVRTVRVDHLRARVHVSGELDMATEDDVVDGLAAAMVSLGPRLTVDVSAVTFCDGRGLAALRRAADLAEDAGGAITLRGASHRLAFLLAVTGETERFSGARPSASSTR